jgi:hypothetical protein
MGHVVQLSTRQVVVAPVRIWLALLKVCMSFITAHTNAYRPEERGNAGRAGAGWEADLREAANSQTPEKPQAVVDIVQRIIAGTNAVRGEAKTRRH